MQSGRQRQRSLLDCMQIAMGLIQWNPQMLTSFVQEVHCMTVRRDDCFFRPCSTAEGPTWAQCNQEAECRTWATFKRQ